MNAAVSYVRALADPDLAGLPDGDLLARFAHDRDEQAFAELVRRHGRMVLGTCRRVLASDDADDCVQATFLVLARRASQFAGRATVGDFLHGVAVRVALKARTRTAKRRAAERRAARQVGFTVAESPDPGTLAALDRAIQALPARLREAVVLCELEGVPRADGAVRLGVPAGTLSSRLATARKRLAARLTAGGFAPVVMAAGAFQDPLTAAVVGVAFGPVGGVPAAVQSLVSEVTTAMMLSKLKPLIAGVMVAATLGAGAGVAQLAGGQEAKSPAQPAKPAEPPKSTAAAEREAAERADPVLAEHNRKMLAEIRRPETIRKQFEALDKEHGALARVTWMVITQAVNGRVLDASEFQRQGVPLRKLEFQGGGWARGGPLKMGEVVRRFGQSDGWSDKAQALYTINPFRTPHELTVTVFADEKDTPPTMNQYIYERTAKNRMRLAFYADPRYPDRPHGFAPADQPDNGQDLVVLELGHADPRQQGRAAAAVPFDAADKKPK